MHTKGRQLWHWQRVLPGAQEFLVGTGIGPGLANGVLGHSPSPSPGSALLSLPRAALSRAGRAVPAPVPALGGQLQPQFQPQLGPWALWVTLVTVHTSSMTSFPF